MVLMRKHQTVGVKAMGVERIIPMIYDYFAINYASVTGFVFLLIFLAANATLDRKIKRIFYLMILIASVRRIIAQILKKRSARLKLTIFVV